MPALPGQPQTPAAPGDPVAPSPVLPPVGNTAAREEEQVSRFPGNEFRFKVRTVKWFGILSAVVILLMIGLGFLYLDAILTEAKPPESRLSFSKVLDAPEPNPTIVTLGLEQDALAMRNKRTVAALSMRAYSQFLAIIAGTALALLGAVFVLARVDSAETRAEAGYGAGKLLMSGASPGIFVTVIGALLVGCTVFFSDDQISATDVPVFSRTTPVTDPIAGAKRREQELKEIRERRGAAR